MGGELTLQVDITITQAQATGVMRVGLVAHSNGGVGSDKAWRLLWANAAETPPAKLTFLEELVAWRANTTAVQLALTKTYTMKMEVRGNTAKGKVWEKGTTEPADWTIVDSNFSSDQLDQTTVGLMANGVDACFDNFSATALPVTLKGTLSGKITSSGTALAGATVEVTGNENQTIAAGDDGSYSLSLDAGNYSVTALAFGYPSVTQTATVTGNQTSTLNIPLTATTRKSATLTVKDGKAVENGLKIVFSDGGGDGYVSFDKVNGTEVIRTGPMVAPYDDQFLYVDVDDSFLYGGLGTGKAYVTMEYLDQGTGSFSMNYDSGPAFPDAQFKGAGGDARTDTGVFKTYTWELDDASFSNREQSFADFRISDGGTGDDNDLYISKVTVSTVPYDQIPTTSVTLGDLNADTKVNVQDATLSLRIAVGLLTPSDDQKTAGDVNKDGKLNIQDTTLILQVAVGLKTGF